MAGSLIRDAFEHHVWATLRVIDACTSLTPEQLATSVPGTYGSILDTMRHIVGADSWYLFRTSGGRVPAIEDGDQAGMDLPALRAAMERHAAVWPTVVAQEGDPDEMIVTRRDDGSEAHASIGMRLAQAIHHGTDHRSQICTELTALGIEPPEIDIWSFGEETARIRIVPTTS